MILTWEKVRAIAAGGPSTDANEEPWDIGDLCVSHEALRAERDTLRMLAAKSASERGGICVYCDAFVDGPPEAIRQLMIDHVAVCAKHPTAALRETLKMAQSDFALGNPWAAKAHIDAALDRLSGQT